MVTENEFVGFMSNYDGIIGSRALRLRQLLLSSLPGITEQIDLPAKMVAYCYGQKYVDLICVIIPSKKGLKLGFNRGAQLPDPAGILEGTGKISRYIQIKSIGQIESAPVKEMLVCALEMYQTIKA